MKKRRLTGPQIAMLLALRERPHAANGTGEHRTLYSLEDRGLANRTCVTGYCQAQVFEITPAGRLAVIEL